jgi:hypothetical protein
MRASLLARAVASFIACTMMAGYDVGRSLYPNAPDMKFTKITGRSDNIVRVVTSTIFFRPISAYRKVMPAR